MGSGSKPAKAPGSIVADFLRTLRFAVHHERPVGHYLMRPVLVGTRTVADSEGLAAVLDARGIPCRLLHA